MAGFSFDSLGRGVSDLGGAVQGVFQAGAAGASEDQYFAARDAAIQNQSFAEQSNVMQQYAFSRKLEATLGAQQAAVAASGFEESGTALDLLRDSTQQGALTHGMIQMHTGQEIAAAKEQENAAEAEAKAASNTGIGDIFGSVLKGAAGVASLVAML